MVGTAGQRRYDRYPTNDLGVNRFDLTVIVLPPRDWSGTGIILELIGTGLASTVDQYGITKIGGVPDRGILRARIRHPDRRKEDHYIRPTCHSGIDCSKRRQMLHLGRGYPVKSIRRRAGL